MAVKHVDIQNDTFYECLLANREDPEVSRWLAFRRGFGSDDGTFAMFAGILSEASFRDGQKVPLSQLCTDLIWLGLMNALKYADVQSMNPYADKDVTRTRFIEGRTTALNSVISPLAQALRAAYEQPEVQVSRGDLVRVIQMASNVRSTPDWVNEANVAELDALVKTSAELFGRKVRDGHR